MILLVEEQTLAGLDSEHGDVAGGARFEGALADARNVEAKILIWLADFHNHRAALLAGQTSPATNAFIRAFEALDGQHGAFLHDDRLPNVESADLLCDLESERDVLLLLLVRLAPRERARHGNRIAEKRPGIEQLHAVLGEFIGNRAENCFRVSHL